MKKHSLKILILLLAVVMLGTVSAGGQKEEALEAAEFEFWTTETQADRLSTIQLLVDTFQALNPQIQITVIPVDENHMPTQVVASAAAGTLPALAETGSENSIDFGAVGLLNMDETSSLIKKIGKSRYASRRCPKGGPEMPHVVRLAPPGWKKEHLVPSDPEQSYPEESPCSVSDTESRSIWAKLIAKVYEVNPLECPRCCSAMKVIAIITEPEEARKIPVRGTWSRSVGHHRGSIQVRLNDILSRFFFLASSHNTIVFIIGSHLCYPRTHGSSALIPFFLDSGMLFAHLEL